MVLEVVQILLDVHANPNEVDNGGATPLHHAAEGKAADAIVALLKVNLFIQNHIMMLRERGRNQNVFVG